MPTSDEVRRLAAVARSLADHLGPADLPCYIGEGCGTPLYCDHCLARRYADSCAQVLARRAKALAKAEAAPPAPKPLPKAATTPPDCPFEVVQTEAGVWETQPKKKGVAGG